jgi:serine/threonine protein kinase
VVCLLTTGTKFGPYEIVAPIGAGGMGEVWKALDTRLSRHVAIKVSAENFSDRFEREARAVAALNHPNIVALYDVGENYIVTELVDGESLRSADLTARKAVEVAAQVAGGLAAAHDAGIVHRDLKPENIMVTRDGRAKILDFGLARRSAAPGPDDTTRTEPGTVMGTVGYMSPEQVRGQEADYRSDIFSFGAVLYEILAKRRAFAGETGAEVMTAILKEDPPELPAAIPAALREIVRHCLEKDPADRFQSAKDLAFALRSLPAESSGAGTVPAIPERRGRRWLLPAAALLAIVAIAADPLLRHAGTPDPWRATASLCWRPNRRWSRIRPGRPMARRSPTWPTPVAGGRSSRAGSIRRWQIKSPVAMDYAGNHFGRRTEAGRPSVYWKMSCVPRWPAMVCRMAVVCDQELLFGRLGGHGSKLAISTTATNNSSHASQIWIVPQVLRLEPPRRPPSYTWAIQRRAACES